MKSYLGIELGSTRIKAVLIDPRGETLATGSFQWENSFIDEVWTYSLKDAEDGLRVAYQSLLEDYQGNHGSAPEIAAIGISAMMHGYLVFDENGRQLAEFRTWRNTITGKSAERLSGLFGFNVPQRYSISHLHRAITRKEAHVKGIAFMTTLAGYIHWRLTGEKVIGVGDASGMFPINGEGDDFHPHFMELFDREAATYGFSQKLSSIMPKVLRAGEQAGSLTEEGAKLLDPTGGLKKGIAFCPPEGDAGTGMAATNAVTALTGNVSAGTSIFAMVVLEHPPLHVYPEIDIVATPDGLPVAMVHCNNCTAELDAWAGLVGEAASLLGKKPTPDELYGSLYLESLKGDADAGGLVGVNYLSGEHTTGFHKGYPLFIRSSESSFTLANFMRNLIYSAMATLRIGMDILVEGENLVAKRLTGHGGIFRTPGVAQKFMAAALKTPLAVLESAGEGGAWGIALLAAYVEEKSAGENLAAFLEEKIFQGRAVSVIEPDAKDAAGYDEYLERYKKALKVERAAVENM